MNLFFECFQNGLPDKCNVFVDPFSNSGSYYQAEDQEQNLTKRCSVWLYSNDEKRESLVNDVSEKESSEDIFLNQEGFFYSSI